MIAALAPASAAAATRAALPDSTVIEAWTLPNGLRVITRHVPLSSAIAVTLAFDSGERMESAARPGLTRLVARLRYFAATGAEPARTAADMARLRPAGWDLQVSARSMRLTEVAALGQFPGVLHQVAARLRGVEVEAADLAAAVASVREDLGAHYRDSLDRVLVYRTRALAEGASDDQIARRAAGAALATVPLKEVRERLAALGTRQAVLSLAGDMNAYPIRRLVENEFGGIPASPAAAARVPPLAPAQRTALMPGLSFPLAAIGVVAPALDDTSHAEFYAAALRLGTYMLGKWGRPEPPFSSRFKYLLLDDPDLALYFPPLTVEGLTVPQLREEFAATAADAFFADPPPNVQFGLRRGVEWMLGGPLPTDLLISARGGGAVLVNLASTAAARALLGDEAFWSGYRERFARGLGGERADWRDWFQDRQRQVEMVLLPPEMR